MFFVNFHPNIQFNKWTLTALIFQKFGFMPRQGTPGSLSLSFLLLLFLLGGVEDEMVYRLMVLIKNELLSLICRKSSVNVIDAKTMSADPVAVVELPHSTIWAPCLICIRGTTSRTSKSVMTLNDASRFLKSWTRTAFLPPGQFLSPAFGMEACGSEAQCSSGNSWFLAKPQFLDWNNEVSSCLRWLEQIWLQWIFLHSAWYKP